MKTAWCFNGDKGGFPSGVFSSRELAEEWIAGERLSGTLTLCPVDIGVYQWAIENEYFTPKQAYQSTPKFIQNFSCEHEHYHYQDGKVVAECNLSASLNAGETVQLAGYYSNE